MRGIKQLLKRWLGDRRGFTLAEITIAMAISSFVMGGVLLVYTQLFSVTATNSNYMAAFRQVQNAGDWITNDTLSAQEVFDMPENPPTLTDTIDAGDTEIAVDNTDDFPASGVILIEDELIEYTGKTGTSFTGCSRGSNAATHADGTSLNFFVGLGRTDWAGNEHWVVYRLNDDREMVRNYFIDPREDDTQVIQWEPQSSTIIAEAIVVENTSSAWNSSDLDLTVEIEANVGGYILGRFGQQSFEATRTYIIHPRPLI